VEDWAEIRRLHRSEQMAVKAIARRLGLARNAVRSALAADTPPKYSRAPQGSRVDEFEPAIRRLLTQFPEMPASVIAERIGWEHSSSVLRARIALLRPLFSPPDPADRTTYTAGEIVQCDLWFPGEVVPVAPKVFADPPVLTTVAAYSGFMMALLLPSRQAGDLVAGMWQLLAGLGGVPKMLVWDNEPGIGQHRRLTLGARSFAGTLGTRIYQAAPRDPETKGVIERANGFFETSFMPGRSFTSPGDYNTQLAAWLPRANARMLRRTGQRPGVLVDEDVAAMGALPPVAPTVGESTRVRLGRDYYVRVAGNDYSVDPPDGHRPGPRRDGRGAAQCLPGAHRRDARTGPRPGDRGGPAGPVALRRGVQPARRTALPSCGPDPAGRAMTTPMSALAGKDVAGEVMFLARELKAPVIAATFTALGDQAREQGWSHEEYLAAVLGRQVASRAANGTKMRISAARFPQIKTLEDFTFTHLPTAPRDVIAHLATTTFVARKENVVLLGPPGIGKTHSC